MRKTQRFGAPGPVRLLNEDDTPDANAEFVGQSMREMRVAKDMTLAELAEAAKLSVGYLSQVERGLSSPSVDALQSIANALGVTIGWFFRAPAESSESAAAYVVRAGARRTLKFDSGITDELLSPNLSGALELLHCTFAPGAASGAEPFTHRGEEAGYVMKGTLEIWVEGQKFVLQAGDSISFPSTKPHRLRNPTDSETTVIWVITPPTY